MRIPKIRETLSWVPLKLKPSANGQELSIATGFFYQHNDRSFLITNSHVVSGRDPNTGSILHPSGMVPDTLILYVATSVTDQTSPTIVQWKPKQLLLYTEGDAVKPIWTEHPKHGRRFDVVAIPLSGLEETALRPQTPLNSG